MQYGGIFYLKMGWLVSIRLRQRVMLPCVVDTVAQKFYCGGGICDDRKGAYMSPKTNDGFSAQEKAAMRERAKELKAQEKAAQQREIGEADVLAKIAEMNDHDRHLAEQVHQVVTKHAPDLWPRTWYGMPAYAKNGKVLCFFQSAQKFESRYCTFGFSDTAHLDDGAMWPTSFALVEWNDAVESRIVALIRQAV
jgi:uncharacterized protein YdhG (YjbR/CyaY superfamily)